MKKKRKNFDPLKNEYSKKSSSSYDRADVINSSKSIYTHTKRKKSKRLGKTCIHFIYDKLTCKLSNQFCCDADKCNFYENIGKETKTANVVNTINIIPTIEKSKEQLCEIGVTVVALNDNRKCTNENHHINDMQAKLRISTPLGEIVNYMIPAAYCSACDTYFILKNDFKEAKKIGIILCPIDDRTQKHLNKIIRKTQIGNESRIHQLGYNVVKGNGYTTEQRHVVLANIVENTNISKYEIISNINKCIAQHKSQINYSESVACWENDLKFIRKYIHGDIPGVIVEKIVVGKRR